MDIDRLLASVLKIYRSNKIYKFVSTGTVSISTWQNRLNKGCIKFKGFPQAVEFNFCNINEIKAIQSWFLEIQREVWLRPQNPPKFSYGNLHS